MYCRWLDFCSTTVDCRSVVLCCLLRCAGHMSWRDCFVNMYKDFGRYIDVYRPIRKAWDQILSFTKENCPETYATLFGIFHIFVISCPSIWLICAVVILYVCLSWLHVNFILFKLLDRESLD